MYFEKSHLLIKFPFTLFNNLKYFEPKKFFHIKYSFCGPFDSATRRGSTTRPPLHPSYGPVLFIKHYWSDKWKR